MKIDTDGTNQYGLPKLPPGQLATGKFPVMTYGPTPIIEREDWGLTVRGLVEEERTFSFDDILAMPQTELEADFHCVTHWSRFGDRWGGVLFRDFWNEIDSIRSDRTKFVLQHAYGGYTTNLSLQVMLEEDVLIAHTFNGLPLEAEHGGPVRIFTPKRYGWKGAKWIRALEFLEEDRPGFWEQNGYHNEGDPWKEERYWD